MTPLADVGARSPRRFRRIAAGACAAVALLSAFAAAPALKTDPAAVDLMQVLESHGWPGNVREVRNLAESAAFLTYGRGPIPVDALPDRIRERRPAPVARLVDTEREAVLRALEEAEGNRSRAARFLGISRQTLYTKMSKFGISRANAA